MRSRFSFGWRSTLVAAAVASLILLPLSQSFADNDRGSFERGQGGLQMAQRGEEAPGQVATYSRANYVWPHATGPFYGDRGKGTSRAPGLLQTSVGTFDLTQEGQLGIPAALKTSNRLAQLGAQYFIVQLDPASVPNGSLGYARQAIEDNGGAIVHTLPVMALVARLTPAAMADLEGTPGLLAIEPYHAAFKLDPNIGRVPLTDPVKAVSEVYDLEARVHPGEDAQAVARELGRIGGKVTTVSPDTVRFEIHRARLPQVAGLEPVFMVFEHVAYMPHAEETTTGLQTGAYNSGAIPYHDAGIDGSGGGIDGSGSGGFAAQPQILMVLDSGIQIDGGDLSHTRTSAAGPGIGPGHRKVRFYDTTNVYGGLGDGLGCDAPPSGGFTHGHVVSATALGNATDVDVSYGPGWLATDTNGNTWKLDGVAPGAVLVAYDAAPTPAATSCQDPLLNNIFPGDLYSGGSTGSLGASYTNENAKIFNFSWGSPTNTYSTGAMDIDQFLIDKGDALVFVSAGNNGLDADNDGIPDLGSLGAPATTKNGLAIGASRAVNDYSVGGAEQERAFFSSTGPVATSNRIAPQLMSPGDEENNANNMGMRSEFSCRSSDNDQLDPVECDQVSQLEGTSFSSPGAAGAALLVRDYFAQGYYPDGTSGNPGNGADQVANVSGALVKAVLIASADYMTGDRPPVFTQAFPGGDNLTIRYRFNNEQGYGRVQLDNALPLETWPASIFGLAVADGGIDGAPLSISGLTGALDATLGEVDTGTFEICNTDDEIRVALTWFDDATNALVNDLDLTLIAPSGTTYYGNYFTDDDNRDGQIDVLTEDCPSIDGTTGTVSSDQWSLPICQRADATISPHDRVNPTEAIMLSSDPLGNETITQIEPGTWTIQVAAFGGTNTVQRYAVAVAGGVCSQSWARLDQVEYSCNQTASAVIYESTEAGDLNPNEVDVSARTTLQVLNSDGIVVDEESGLAFTRPDPAGTKFVAESLILTDGTAPDPGNGVLDVRDGDVIKVVYQDVDAAGIPDPNKVRVSSADVNCAPRVGFGNIVFAQYGQDTTFFVAGGCERNARGQFEFGFPDRYMDADESISFRFAFASNESIDLANVEVDLRCFIADTDSPADCRPDGTGCDPVECGGTCDPTRSNNATCDGRPSGNPGDTSWMTVIDTPKRIGLITAGSALSANFSIQMASAIPGTPEVDLGLQVKADTSGKTTNALEVSRHRLDVDEQTFLYSTDFPTGGTEFIDIQNNETQENPTTNPGFFVEDYVFETRNYSDLTDGGANLINSALLIPWNFDANDGGFQSGLLATSDESTITNTIAQWGEDKNFNGEDDRRCSDDVTVECTRDTDCAGTTATCDSVEDRDPANGQLDRSWNIRGGCGWQTKAPGTCSNLATQGCFDDGDCPGTGTCTGPSDTGGMWHTGRIGGTTGACLVTGNTPGQCQAYETVGGSSGLRSWREHLITPVMSKVNGTDYTAEIVMWRWNQSVDIADNNVAWVWEFDTDTLSLEPVDLFTDNSVLGGLFGAYGSVANENNPRLTNGFSIFAPLDPTLQNSLNGSDADGNNREGKNSCFFEGGAIPAVAYAEIGLAGPPDDDIDNDGDGTIDEFVTVNGPFRNMDVNAVNGPDMRFSTLEDIYGDTQQFFQGSVGFWTFEASPADPPNSISYGLGVDDMVVEWREFTLVQDTTDCVTGECAVVDLTTNNTFEGSTLVTITVLEKTPPATNDCDFNCRLPNDPVCAGGQTFCVGGDNDGLACTDVAGDTDCPPDGDCVDFSPVCAPLCFEGGPTLPNDCDDDGTADVAVRVVSNTEFTGEVVYANATGVPNEYKVDLPISAKYDSPGVLFVAQLGTDLPVITATYNDVDDGTGNVCRNDVDTAAQGQVQVNGTFFLNTGNMTVISTELTDNGDADGFPDTNETVDMKIRVTNKGNEDLTGLAARLSTNDPKIDCILNAFINIGDLAVDEIVTTTGSFTFHVADVDRTTAGLTDLDDFSARFQILFSADQFDGTSSPQGVTIDLDLDAAGGSGPTTFFEGFESGALTTFTANNMDENLGNLTAADRYRCQYSDPDWINSNSYGAISDCFPTAGAIPDPFFWNVYTTAAPDGGRAFSGSSSLYYGIYPPAGADLQTTPTATLEAVEQINPINLGFSGAPPELSFKHQHDLMDSRTVNAPVGDSAGRSVPQLQLADGADNPVGNWIKLQPYLNVYDQQGVDNYFNCVFDPIDDGSDEDDYFDPTDPERRLGPSSTCKPEFVFTYQGDTFNAFSETALGLATDGPGLQGALGIGTWIESKFNLERFKGRRVRLRFLVTDLKLGTTATWEDAFGFNPSPGDDGIWIDDITVSNTLVSPTTIVNDDKDNSALPGCGNICNTVNAMVTADPPGTLPAPGQVVELDALGSTADRCLDGVLQYQFSADGTVLRGWTDNSVLADAPLASTTYTVDVRCSTDPTCTGSVNLPVAVDCPLSGNLGFPKVLAIPGGFLSWGTTRAFDFVRGDLASVSSYTVLDSGSGNDSQQFICGIDPVPGQGFWYLYRDTGVVGTGGSGFCNDPGITWGSPARDAVLP